MYIWGGGVDIGGPGSILFEQGHFFRVGNFLFIYLSLFFGEEGLG